jgi:O-antigen/teichoic acid export membrane protein
MFNLVGTPTAILRLFNCFGLLSKTRVTAATIKVICLAIAFYFNGDLWIFLLVWMSMHILDYSLILGAGWYEMNSQGFHKTMAAGLKDISKKFSGIWKFVVSTNLSSSIRLVAMEGDILLVGALIGTKAAGLYKVARQFGMIPGRFADPLQQAVYPDMAKLWATGSAKKFRSYILRIGLLAGMGGITIWIFFVIGGKLVLSLTVGKEFIPAHNLLIVYMIGLVIFMFGVAFRPAVLSMEHAERILIIYTGSTIVYSIVLILLLTQIGVMGASIAQVVFHTCWFFAMAISIRSFIRKALDGNK